MRQLPTRSYAKRIIDAAILIFILLGILALDDINERLFHDNTVATRPAEARHV